MKGIVRILHLEDNDSDSELVVHYLSDENLPCEVIRVASHKAFNDALDHQKFDLIISDYSIPAFNGREALKIARIKRPEIPFLFFSGTIGEEHAIETLKLGATDYVLKDRMARLGPAIRRALEETQERNRRMIAEEELKKSQEHYRLVAELSPDMIFVESGGRIVFMNPAGMRLLGANASSEVINKSISNMISEEHQDTLKAHFEALLHGYKPPPQELRLVRLDGTTVEIELTAALLETYGSRGVLGMARNITERKRMEDELHHSQKMEAVGQLAGGLAHDFNNSLMAIYGYAEMLLLQLSANNENRKQVQALLDTAAKSAALTRQLMAFSRKQVLALQVLNANSIVEEFSEMMGRLVGANIHIELELQKSPARIKADAGRLDQVLMNLAVNARDAMPGGGTLRISTTTIELPETGTHPGGKFLRLSVQDNGSGMTEDVKSRCFEPFFTTKEKGKGTGLGLSNVYAIVRQMNGYLTVDSTLGAGTTFHLDFPAVDSAEWTETKKSIVTTEPDIQVLIGCTILLVDDNEPVLHAMSLAFKKLGGRLLTAKDGIEALKIIDQEKQIDLMVTDVMMPYMSGFQLAEQVRKRCPNLKVIFISGYSEDALDGSPTNDPNSTFLYKPTSIAQLVSSASKLMQI